MNNNYNIVRTIFENVFQRVLECKINETGEIFYSNVITSKKVINLINIDELNKLTSNIIECYSTEDRIFIYTKPLKSEFINIKEYIKIKKLTLKQQFALSKKVIELSSGIFNMTDVVQQKILDLDRIYIDENDEIIVDCNLIFEQEYDISDNETFKRMGNIIHYIFSQSEIVDYNISEIIPPDILKIIVRCLTKEYFHPSDALKDLIDSPIYNMIYGDVKHDFIDRENLQNTNSIKDPDNSLYLQEKSLSDKSGKTDEDSDKILDIYLNSNATDKKANTNSKGKALISKDIIRSAVSLVIVIMVLMLGKFLMNQFKSEDVNKENPPLVVNPDESEINNPDDSTVEENEKVETVDSTEKYFNKELLEKIGYTGDIAEIDNDIYVEGEKSLVIKNEAEGKVKSLFAAIDFNDEDFSYMLKRQIGVSLKTKAENDTKALIVLEAYKDGVLASTFHTSIQIYNDMWSQNFVPINVTNADSLNIYIEYEGKNRVWIDSIYIDVIK